MVSTIVHAAGSCAAWDQLLLGLAGQLGRPGSTRSSAHTTARQQPDNSWESVESAKYCDAEAKPLRRNGIGVPQARRCTCGKLSGLSMEQLYLVSPIHCMCSLCWDAPITGLNKLHLEPVAVSAGVDEAVACSSRVSGQDELAPCPTPCGYRQLHECRQEWTAGIRHVCLQERGLRA
jgi:hypothetical protein